MSAAILRSQIASDQIVVAPGVYDHISLRLAQEAGSKAVYASGYWGMGSAYGLPDVGVAGFREFIETFSRFAQNSELPVIADADTGFGSLISLDYTVRGYCRAGIAAMQIEDQKFPKTCGHTVEPNVVTIAEMVSRITVGVEARENSDMLIIARTDARRSEGAKSAQQRLQAYADAGADIVFLEAPETEAEIAHAAASVDKPLMINAAHGGRTPILSPKEYETLGAKIVIYPGGAALCAAKAVQAFYRKLANGDASKDEKSMYPFSDMSRLLGIEKVIEFQAKHNGS